MSKNGHDKEYAPVVDALAPVLHNLPPRIIAIDGRPGCGKTTLGRFLAWWFNVSLMVTTVRSSSPSTIGSHLLSPIFFIMAVDGVRYAHAE
jgi:hypothetical protein